MKKRILSLILLLCSVMLLALPITASSDGAAQQSERPESFYTPVSGYYYQLDRKLSNSIDSFEAWIKMPELSFGGRIFAMTYSGNYYWGIDYFGRFEFKWGSDVGCAFSDTPNLADGEWHHIALVRTSTEFTYYLDGEVAGVYEAETTPVTSPQAYNIGFRGTQPFEGYIKQVTIYEGAISHEQVLSDMNNTNITSDSGDAKLLANWNLGDYWTERYVHSTSENSAIAELHTYDKMVKADYSFGEYDYTFAIFPDIQIMTNYNPTRLNNQIQWLVDHKDEMNVKFALFVGDLSDFGQREYLYERAASAMSRLDNIIPYCFVPGNHDYDDNAMTSRNQVYFNRHFSYEKHTQLPGYAGCYEEGTMTNNYYIFEVGDGIKYLVLNLEYKPRLKILRWANIVVESHPDCRVIMNTHSYLSSSGEFSSGASVGGEGNGGKTIFETLMVNHANIFMGVGGHEDNSEPVHRIEYGVNGNKILSMLCDVQASKYKDDNILDVFMLVHVNEEKKTMNFVYYSPAYDGVLNIQGQFELSFADSYNPAIGE